MRLLNRVRFKASLKAYDSQIESLNEHRPNDSVVNDVYKHLYFGSKMQEPNNMLCVLTHGLQTKTMFVIERF